MATPHLPAPLKPEPLAVQIIKPPIPASQMTDADIGKAAAEAVDLAVSQRESSIEHAKRAGELLLEAKHRCRELGVSFRHWLQKHWTKSHSTAHAYITIATEVQPSSVGAPDKETKDLLSCQSIRAFLTERGFGAGGTRGSEDPDEAAANEEKVMERIAAPEAPRGRAPTPSSPPPPPSLGQRAGQKSVQEQIDKTMKATADAKAALEAEDEAPPPEKDEPAPVVSGPADDCQRHASAIETAVRFCALSLAVEIHTPSLDHAVARARQIAAHPMFAELVTVLREIESEDREVCKNEQARIDEIHRKAKARRAKAGAA